MASTPFGVLRYLYVGSSDVGRDLEYYVKVLNSKKVWDLKGFGARVGAAEVCNGLSFYLPAIARFPPVFLFSK